MRAYETTTDYAGLVSAMVYSALQEISPLVTDEKTYGQIVDALDRITNAVRAIQDLDQGNTASETSAI